jgi:hypothetical protein
MKNLLLIFILLFSTVFFISPSNAEWTKVSENYLGDTYYVDFERIRKVDGFVYWWDLRDFLKPMINATMSGKLYNQGDCKLNRYKVLSDSFYKKPMGRGEILSGSNVPDKEWRYPSLNSMNEVILKTVCSR